MTKSNTENRLFRQPVRALLMLGFACLCFASPSQAACPSNTPMPTYDQLVADKRSKLQGPLSVEELEKANMIEVRETKQKVPFGYMNEEWSQLKAAIKPGDKIHLWSFREGSYFHDGYILVREGCIVKFLPKRIS